MDAAAALDALVDELPIHGRASTTSSTGSGRHTAGFLPLRTRCTAFASRSAHVTPCGRLKQWEAGERRAAIDCACVMLWSGLHRCFLNRWRASGESTHEPASGASPTAGHTRSRVLRCRDFVPKIALDLHGNECPDPKELLDRYALRGTRSLRLPLVWPRLLLRPAHPALIG